MCLEKILVHGRSSLSTAIIRDDNLDKLQNFNKSGIISNNVSKLVAPSTFGTNYIETAQSSEQRYNMCRKDNIS